MRFVCVLCGCELLDYIFIMDVADFAYKLRKNIRTQRCQNAYVSLKEIFVFNVVSIYMWSNRFLVEKVLCSVSFWI